MRLNHSILFLCCILAGMDSIGQSENALIRKGNKLYKEGKFDNSLPQYQKALELNRANPVTNYNLGDAFFRDKKMQDAEKSFELASAPTSDPVLRQKAYYNKGVALSRQNKLEESIEAYKNAVKLDPNDENARVNLQKALLELRKKTPPEKEKKDNKEEQKKKDKDKKGQEPPPPPQSKLTKKQVEQLLKALQQREQQVQQKMQQNRTRATTQPDKDW